LSPGYPFTELRGAYGYAMSAGISSPWMSVNR